jgi:hypothetical protein
MIFPTRLVEGCGAFVDARVRGAAYSLDDRFGKAS